VRWAVLALVLVAGCSHNVTPPPPPPAQGSAVVSWVGNGNPGSPVCPAAADCINGFELDDLTAGTSASLPLTQFSYTITGVVGPHVVEVWTVHQGSATATLVLTQTVNVAAAP
jgi:hypothetical protein